MKVYWQRVVDIAAAMARSFRDGLIEIWNLLVVIAGMLDPRKLPGIIRRDTGAVIQSGKFVATATTEAAADVATQAAASPHRLGQWLIHAPGRLFRFLITRSPMQLLVGSLVAVVGLTVSIGSAYLVFKDRRIRILEREQHRQLEEHFIRADFTNAEHNINVLLQFVNANDPKTIARKKAFETGISPPNDPKMARLLMRKHLSQNRRDDALREAQAYRESYPDDWEATLLLADAALRKGDRAAASKIVSKMKRPYEISPWSCLMAAQVFRILDESARLDDLIGHLTDHYLPLVQLSFVANIEPESRVQLVELYNLCMTTLAQRPILQRYWVPVQEICHGIANAPVLTVGALLKLGWSQETQREQYLKQMLNLKLIEQSQYDEYVAEIDNRLTLIWRRLREIDAKNYVAYVGPAMQMARRGDFRAAIAEIDLGIERCGQLPGLVEKKAEMFRRVDPAAGLAYLEETLGGREIKPEMCRVIADAALAAGRPDKALEATQKALAAYPKLSWALRLQAHLQLESGRPAEAVALLNDAPIAFEDAAVSALYVRALVASGAVPGAEAFLQRMIASPDLRRNVLSGIETLAKLGHPELAITLLKKLLNEDPLNGAAQAVLGDTLRILAEDKPSGWDRQLIDDAIQAYRKALLRDPNQYHVISQIAWLELVALEVPLVAFETAKPLRESGNVSPEVLATIGATHVAVGQFEPGRIALEKSLRSSGAKPSTLAYLALAYHGLNRTDAANQCIGRAVNTPKSGPREAELVDAIRRKIQRGG